jgi:hypothetical protein
VAEASVLERFEERTPDEERNAVRATAWVALRWLALVVAGLAAAVLAVS